MKWATIIAVLLASVATAMVAVCEFTEILRVHYRSVRVERSRAQTERRILRLRASLEGLTTPRRLLEHASPLPPPTPNAPLLRVKGPTVTAVRGSLSDPEPPHEVLIQAEQQRRAERRANRNPVRPRARPVPVPRTRPRAVLPQGMSGAEHFEGGSR